MSGACPLSAAPALPPLPSLPACCQVQHLINHFLSAVCLHFYTLPARERERERQSKRKSERGYSTCRQRGLGSYSSPLYSSAQPILVSLMASRCFHLNYFLTPCSAAYIVYSYTLRVSPINQFPKNDIYQIYKHTHTSIYVKHHQKSHSQNIWHASSTIYIHYT